MSFAEYRAWKDATTRFVATAAYLQTTMNVTDGERAPERRTGAYVSAETFPLLGQKPIAGRGFAVEDDRPGATPVVILGGSAWRTRYDGRSTVLGRTIRVNGIPSTVVGVMPDGFGFPANAELWQPLALHPAVSTAPRSTRLLNVVGRLADGVTLADAQVELDGIAARLAQEFPDSNTAIHPTVTPYAERHLPPQIRLIFLALMGAVAFVLLIACANVANLLLGRAARRMREVSIRVSLGATRGRIVRQLLIESVVIATISGVAGFALSVLGLRLFHLIIANLGAPPYWISFTMDLRVFAFLAAVCLSTGVVFGLAPALHVSRANVNTRVNEHGRGSGHPRTRWTGAFVVVQVSLTMVLLAGAGYFARSFLDAYRFDPGFDPSGLVRMALVLPQADYPTPETRASFAAQLDARLRRLSSEMRATVTSTAPFQAGDRVQLSLAGVGDADRVRREALVRTIGPDYFTTFNQSLRLGRPFMEQDGGVGREAAIIDERLAALLFPNANPIGARINMTRRTATEPSKAWVTVVGVAPSLPQRNVAVSEPVLYLPFGANALVFSNLYVFVRTNRAVDTAVTQVRHELRLLDPDLPLAEMSTFDEWLAFFRSPERTFGTLFGIFAGMALLLATIGLYAVVAYSVTQRTSELAVRAALGATTRHIEWLVMRRGLGQLAAGLALGLVGAYAVGTLLNGTLGAKGNDTATLVGIVSLLSIVALGACFWPARRAARLDPIVALRCE